MLAGNLELTRLDYSSIRVKHMINVNTTVEIVQVNGKLWGGIKRFIYLFPKHTIVNIDGKTLPEVILQIKSNVRGCRVGI